MYFVKGINKSTKDMLYGCLVRRKQAKIKKIPSKQEIIFKPGSNIIKTTDSNGNIVYQVKGVKYKPVTIILVSTVILICLGLILYLTVNT
jgi:hypothetical protein